MQLVEDLQGATVGPTPLYELGKLDRDRDRLDAALKSAEQARFLAPNAPIIYRLLANIHPAARKQHGTA